MKKKSKQFAWYIGVFTFLCVVVCFLPMILTHGSIMDFTQTGQIGDTIGGIMGPFVAIIAAFLTFVAFWVQKDANDAQRQDIKMERFNSNFYNLLSIHEQITDSLEFNTHTDGVNQSKEKMEYHGRELFYYAFEVVTEHDKDKKYKGMHERLKKTGPESYEDSNTPTYFDHYFRNLYRIVKYVDETDVFDNLSEKERFDKKYEYVAILRSTLSRYELVWLFYNSLSSNGKEKFKPLVEKYALLKNVRVDLLVDIADVSKYEKGAYSKDYPA